MRKFLKISLTSFIIIILLLGFALPLNPAGNWYQQFLPNLNGRQIVDITFTDSLSGYAIANRLTLQDTSFILRTTNGGDNWFFAYSDSGVTYTSIKFINQNTGFVGGYIYKGGLFKLVKTTNNGSNWFYINAPFDVPVNEVFALNEDTIWLASNSNPSGGVFRTTNGGTNWAQQLNLANLNPNHIYMYNARIGFITEENGGTRYVRKTTDSGFNWFQIVSNDDYRKIFFTDTLTGWKTSVFGMKKTTDGGLNWVTQTIPFGGIIQSSFIYDFSVLNKDTLWGTGGFVMYPNGQTRGILYRTVNGGDNWLFQIPDTSINISYSYMRFTDRLHGWVYSTSPTGIHTKLGGDTNFIVGVKQVSGNIPKEYKLYQNYPNPFNSMTKLKFQMSKQGYAQIRLFDITGRELSVIVNEKLNAGEYETTFDANNLSSGVYLYSLIIDSKIIDTKKMILLK